KNWRFVVPHSGNPENRLQKIRQLLLWKGFPNHGDVSRIYLDMVFTLLLKIILWLAGFSNSSARKTNIA
ncbi:MAG: hypothetical protein ACU84H_11650, partial [Gammaproteobacteria bacterium]